MTGTLLDAAVCLLLVGAAAAVVATAEDPEPTPSDDEAVTMLSTVTHDADGRHGTLAELLAAAAVADAAGVNAPAANVRPAVRGAVGDGVRVVARWEPYPDAPVSGRVTVGPAPPDDATVHAARLIVPVGEPVHDPSPARLAAAIVDRLVVRNDSADDRPRPVADAYGLTPAELHDDTQTRTRERLRRAVADRVTGETGTDARPNRVVVTVRWWPP